MKALSVAGLLIGLHLLLLPGSPAASDQKTTVLLIRPEKIGLAREQGDARLTRDPFTWSAAQVEHFRAADRKNRAQLFAGFTLTGIIWDRAKPLAIINGKMLEVGDHIKGARVRKISKESVLLQKQGINYRLEFEASIIGLKPGK